MFALQHHFRNSNNVIVWFDLFSVNYHIESFSDSTWLCSYFESFVQGFGHTVMVFAPLNNPVPLSRGWCIFELYSTVVTNSRFEIAMSSRHWDLFFEDVKNSPQNLLRKLRAAINVRDCEYFDGREKLKIVNALLNSNGGGNKNLKDFEHQFNQRIVNFGSINSWALERMQGWAVNVVQRTYQKIIALDRVNVVVFEKLRETIVNKIKISISTEEDRIEKSRLQVVLSELLLLDGSKHNKIIPVVLPDLTRSIKPYLFPTNGVRVSFLLEFIQACGGREAFEGLTTRNVCDELIYPATKAAKVSFCDYLKFLNHEDVAPSEVYISHGTI